MLMALAAILGLQMRKDTEGKGEMRYLALGDSYTIGESVANADRWPVQLRDSLRRQGIVLAEPEIIARTGWRTDNLLSAMAAADLQPRYDLVTLLIGVNDYFQGRSRESYVRNLDELLGQAVSLARGRKDRVFVLSIPDYSHTPSYSFAQSTIGPDLDLFNAACKERCEARGIRFIDITPTSRLGLQRTGWVAHDGLHPAGPQYAAWAAVALPIVQAALGHP